MSLRRADLFAAFFCIAMAALVGCATTPARALEPCRIEVVDGENQWPVPLVEFRTTHDVALVSDNAGVIALDQPELMNREVWFHVAGHGYGMPKDGFGYSGVRLTPQPGATLRVEVVRTNVAKRLGRLTGGGIFGESQRFGDHADWRETGVFGCDTVQLAAHRGRLHWLWGDTDLPHYPLGVFTSTSATSPLRPLAKFEPPIALAYDYFTNDKGVPRGVAALPGEGPTWLGAMVSLPDRDGQPRLVATYSKIRGFLEAYEIGLCVWNDETKNFERLRALWTKSDSTPKPPLYPDGHAVLWTEDAGRAWVLFGNPLPTLRCAATFEAWHDADQWEQLTPQETLRSAVDGGDVDPHAGSIAWSDFRGRWVTVFHQMGGKPSHLGEVWYAEADAPTGPWGPAVKVLTHDNYTFYNVRLHPEFVEAGSPILLFEGTYTTLFADKPTPTPRYDYNQILYRLDLDDAALSPAHASSR